MFVSIYNYILICFKFRMKEVYSILNTHILLVVSGLRLLYLKLNNFIMLPLIFESLPVPVFHNFFQTAANGRK